MRGCIIRYFPQVGLEGEPGTCYHPHTIDNPCDVDGGKSCGDGANLAVARRSSRPHGGFACGRGALRGGRCAPPSET
jgi:hypothetical protein